MHILYADESDYKTKAKQTGFVLVGVSVVESQTRALSQELNAIAARFNPAEPRAIELHASPMTKSKSGWRRYPRADREQAITDALQVFARSHSDNRLFAVVVEPGVLDKTSIRYAVGQLAEMFNSYLSRLNERGNKQHGIMLFDESTHANAIQSLTLARHDKGQLANIAEVPVFMDSRMSRLIQLADLAAYSVNLHMRGDDKLFNIIAPRLDNHAGEVCGLHIRTTTKEKKQ